LKKEEFVEKVVHMKEGDRGFNDKCVVDVQGKSHEGIKGRFSQLREADSRLTEIGK